MSEPSEPGTPRIQLGHGSGGKLTHDLIRDLFARQLSNPILDPLDDGGVIPSLTSEPKT